MAILANFKTLASLRSCHVTSFQQRVNEDFEDFRAYLMEFSIYFHEIPMVARSYPILAADIKNLLTISLVSLETRLNFPILAIFGDFWHF